MQSNGGPHVAAGARVEICRRLSACQADRHRPSTVHVYEVVPGSSRSAEPCELQGRGGVRGRRGIAAGEQDVDAKTAFAQGINLPLDENSVRGILFVRPEIRYDEDARIRIAHFEAHESLAHLRRRGLRLRCGAIVDVESSRPGGCDGGGGVLGLHVGSVVVGAFVCGVAVPPVVTGEID